MPRKHLLPWMKRNPVNRFIVGFIASFIVFSIAALVILYPARLIYYGIASGDFLLNVQSVTAETTVERDDILNVTFCRTPRVHVVAKENYRTFYLTDTGEVVFQRQLPDDIFYEKKKFGDCEILKIKPEQRPNDLGKYIFCQSFNFYTEFGQLKTVDFCSTQYEVVSPTKGYVPDSTLNLGQ